MSDRIIGRRGTLAPAAVPAIRLKAARAAARGIVRVIAVVAVPGRAVLPEALA